MDTQDWINTFFHDMESNTLYIVVPTTKYGTGKEWALVWIPYNYWVDVFTHISFQLNLPPIQVPHQRSYRPPMEQRTIHIRSIKFQKWDGDGTPQSKQHNINIQLLLNGSL